MPKSKTYEEFVEKFKPKKTTDDCYTPPEIYEAVKEWACAEYSIDPDTVVRPFWPGGDYEAFDYPEGCTVIDNPPFSILKKICDFYAQRGIKYFLFTPALTLFTFNYGNCHFVAAQASITYENGAEVRTSFRTNLDPALIRTAPDLYQKLKEVNDKLNAKPELPKYEYPDCVITAARMGWYTIMGIDFRIMPDEAHFIRALDAQRDKKKEIFGAGFLVPEAKAAKAAKAANAAKVTAWPLSEEEQRIVDDLAK